MGKRRCCECDDDLLLPPLPEQVLIQILLWLPVISLLRFKSVCKSWCSFIGSSFFIDLHTATTFNSSKFGNFVFQTRGNFEDPMGMQISMLSSESESESESSRGWYTDNDQEVFKVDNDDQVVFKLVNLGFPSCYKVVSRPHVARPSLTNVLMVGSCNGLICLHATKQRHVSLWNPATRQFRILPKSIAFGNYINDFVAFGFDVKSKDYKVVQISWPQETVCRVQVYSLSTDSWRLLEGINSLPGQARPVPEPLLVKGLYMNGSYFFVGEKMGVPMLDKILLSFDFTKEIFTCMQFPDHDINQLHIFSLSYLGEKMALFQTTPKLSDFPGADEFDSDDCDGCDDCENYDIWVLDKESWTKLHSFGIKNIGPTVPRGISNNGEFAFLQKDGRGLDKRMQLFNLVTKEAQKDFLICKWVLRADAYKPSLVSIRGGHEMKQL